MTLPTGTPALDEALDTLGERHALAYWTAATETCRASGLPVHDWHDPANRIGREVCIRAHVSLLRQLDLCATRDALTRILANKVGDYLDHIRAEVSDENGDTDPARLSAALVRNPSALTTMRTVMTTIKACNGKLGADGVCDCARYIAGLLLQPLAAKATK